MNCPICGSPYLLGGRRHLGCEKVRDLRGRLDEAVAWVMSDDPLKGPMPDLVRRLRNEILSEPLDGKECRDESL